ncbi:MAG: hypothetical protein QOI34_851 [Verrucomicrobiota bacterium]|jgi:uncharacterized protein (DUF433 family)/DNA-binding transcriptional regulator YiaG
MLRHTHRSFVAGGGTVHILDTIIRRQKPARAKRRAEVLVEQPADLRELPAYGLTEAAHYLRVPLATLRSWVGGRRYPTEAGRKSFKPIITLPDRCLRSLSFMNLIEAHVLHAVQAEHHFPRIPLPRAHSALDYVREQFNSKHPLAEKRFGSDGLKVFVARFQGVIPAPESRQAAIRERIQAYLDRIEYDANGVALLLYPFTNEGLDQPKNLVIDPFISFGRPTIRGTGVSTRIIAARHEAGDSVTDLTEDYGCKQAQIEEAIRCERLLAS